MGILWTSGFSNNTDVFVKPHFIRSPRSFLQEPTKPSSPTKAMPGLQGEDPIPKQELVKGKAPLLTASPDKLGLKTPGLQPACLASSSTARTGEKSRALLEPPLQEAYRYQGRVSNPRGFCFRTSSPDPTHSIFHRFLAPRRMNGKGKQGIPGDELCCSFSAWKGGHVSTTPVSHAEIP